MTLSMCEFCGKVHRDEIPCPERSAVQEMDYRNQIIAKLASLETLLRSINNFLKDIDKIANEKRFE